MYPVKSIQQTHPKTSIAYPVLTTSYTFFFCKSNAESYLTVSFRKAERILEQFELFPMCYL